MRLARIGLLLALVLAAIATVMLPRIDASYGYGAAAPEEYFRDLGPSGRYGDVACAPSDGVQDARRNQNGTITAFMGAGADTAVLGPGTSMRLFDIESGWGGDDHDMLVVVGIDPDLLSMYRYGPHFVICGDRAPLEIVVLRQYCRGEKGDDGWNNGFEEIVFASSREIWLADDLYAAWQSDGDLAAISRLDAVKDTAKLLKKENAAEWRVRSFSDAMPDTWFASWACRRDLS